MVHGGLAPRIWRAERAKNEQFPLFYTRRRWAARLREDAMLYILERLLYYSCGTALHDRPTVAPSHWQAWLGEMLKLLLPTGQI